MFNVLPTYNDEAHENLSKAIKLNPKLAEAWNSLGLCFWKKGDLLGAKRCFEGGLQHVSFASIIFEGVVVYFANHLSINYQSVEKQGRAKAFGDGTTTTEYKESG